MKSKRGASKDWRCPLSDESLRVLQDLKPFARGGFNFPNQSGKGVMSDATMARFMTREGLRYRPHGFRATFRTWSAENGHGRDVTELCLAHEVYGRVEKAYIRTDFLEQRAALMDKWSEYVISGRVAA